MSDEKRIGDWIQTYTGRQFWIFDPRPEDFNIEDIARSLSQICRFGGHCRPFYSVAQHSYFVSCLAEKEAKVRGLITRPFALAGLLHDAAEAYIGDCVRPLKRTSAMMRYRDVEKSIEEALAQRFQLTYPFAEIIKAADEIILMTEARDLMQPAAVTWNNPAKPLENITILPKSPEEAYAQFMQRFEGLQA